MQASDDNIILESVDDNIQQPDLLKYNSVQGYIFVIYGS